MLDPSNAVLDGFGSRCIRCLECKKSFRPNPRLKSRQKTCAQRACQLSYRARYRKNYRRENFKIEKEYRAKTKSNRPADFWKHYRKDHPKSSEHNRLNTKLRKQLRHAGLQRQLDIVQVIESPEYFTLYTGFAMSHRSLLQDHHATSAA